MELLLRNGYIIYQLVDQDKKKKIVKEAYDP